MERAEVIRVSLPGQPDCFKVALSYEGQPLEAPAASEEEAQAALAVLSAKASQLAGDTDWHSGLLELQPEWLDYIGGCSFTELVEALASGAAKEEEGKAGAGSPGTLDQPPELMEQDGPAAEQHEDAQAAALGKDMCGAEHHGAQAADEEGALPIRARGRRRTGAHHPAGSTGVHGVHRKQDGRLGMQMQSPWGRLSLRVPDIKTGGRLHDTALIWRTVRQAEGAHVAADGKPQAGSSLPALRAEDLPLKMNHPVSKYTRDSELMGFLSQASFQELKARLQAEAEGALGEPHEPDGNGGSSDEEEGAAPAGRQLPHGVHRDRCSLCVRLNSAYGLLRVYSVKTAAQGARLYDTGLIWRRMRQRKGTQCDSQGRPAGGQPLPPLEPGERPALLNAPLESYLADRSLMEFLGTAGFDELTARLKQETKGAEGAQDPGHEAQPASSGGVQDPGAAISSPPAAGCATRRPASGKDSTKPAAAGHSSKRARHTPSRPGSGEGGRAADGPASGASNGAGTGAAGAAGQSPKRARQESQPAGLSSVPPLETPATAAAVGSQPMAAALAAAPSAAAAAPPNPSYNMPAAAAPASLPAAATLSGPEAAPASAAGPPSADDMLDQLQPTLEPLLPAPALLEFELAFPDFPPSRQRALWRSIQRAAGLGNAEAVGHLVRKSMQKGCPQ